MRKLLSFIFFFLSFFNLKPSQTQTENKELENEIIIVHGTFAKDFEWYKEGGNFYEELKKSAEKKFKNNVSLKPFSWSGGVTACHRIKASQDLAEYILKNRSKKFFLIGHSHGSNIINLASQLLEVALYEKRSTFRNKKIKKIAQDLEKIVKEEILKLNICYKNNQSLETIEKSIQEAIKRLEESQSSRATTFISKKEFIVEESFLLATPVNEELYLPSNKIIKETFSIYSLGDIIQPVLGLYERKYSQKNDHILNLEAKFLTVSESGTLGHDHPSHSEVHSPVVARKILEIPNLIEKMDLDWDKIDELEVKFFSNNRDPMISVKKFKDSCSQDTQLVWDNVSDLFGFRDFDLKNNEKKDKYILIHGTFASDSSWYKKGGDFYSRFEKTLCKNTELDSFTWTGKLSPYDRLKGAENLSLLILKNSNDFNLNLIGHSHGGNVIIICSQILDIALFCKNQSQKEEKARSLAFSLEKSYQEDTKKWGLKNSQEASFQEILAQVNKSIQRIENIKKVRSFEEEKHLVEKVFLLATPINEEFYYPKSTVFNKVYSFYSQADLVQPVAGIFERKFKKTSDFIINIQTQYFRQKESGYLEKEYPGHSQMHSEFVAAKILEIPKIIENMSLDWKKNPNLCCQFFLDEKKPNVFEVKDELEEELSCFDQLWDNVEDFFERNLEEGQP